MSRLTFNGRGVILDACCVINLYASLCTKRILSSIPVQVLVADYVMSNESLCVLYGSDGNCAAIKEQIDLLPFVGNGDIEIASIDVKKELETFMYFASQVDDGEAITGAMAYHRNLAIATDDVKAAKLFKSEAPAIQVISTPELLKHWADNDNASFQDISTALKNIRFRARYAPEETHGLYEWWVQAEDQGKVTTAVSSRGQ